MAFCASRDFVEGAEVVGNVWERLCSLGNSLKSPNNLIAPRYEGIPPISPFSVPGLLAMRTLFFPAWEDFVEPCDQQSGNNVFFHVLSASIAPSSQLFFPLSFEMLFCLGLPPRPPPASEGVPLPFIKALKGSLFPSEVSTKAVFAVNTQEIS